MTQQATPSSTEEEFWTPSRIAKFWDLVALEPRLSRMYFSLTYAKPIIAIARLFGMTDGKVMDYGCGPGYLSRQLAISGFDTTGMEHSEASARSADSLLAGLDCWHGCHTPSTLPESLANEAFDWVFSVEAYEHLREEWIPDYFKRIRNILKKGGRLLITTPNEEVLDASLVICPCCESKFHRWGHLRSVTHGDLRQAAEHYGFETIVCHPVNLEEIQGVRVTPIDRTLTALGLCGRTVRKAPADTAPMVMALLRQIRQSEMKPHLLLIARKP